MRKCTMQHKKYIIADGWEFPFILFSFSGWLHCAHCHSAVSKLDWSKYIYGFDCIFAFAWEKIKNRKTGSRSCTERLVVVGNMVGSFAEMPAGDDCNYSRRSGKMWDWENYDFLKCWLRLGEDLNREMLVVIFWNLLRFCEFVTCFHGCRE